MSTAVAPTDPRFLLSEDEKMKIFQANMKATGLADDVPFSTGCIISYYIGLIVIKIYAAAVCIFNPDIHLVSTPLAWIVAVAYLVSVPNIWPLLFCFFREHVTINRYPVGLLIKSSCFWTFLLDQFVFSIPALLLLYSVAISGTFIPMHVVLILNLFVFLLIVLCHKAGNGEQDDDKPWVLLSSNEEATPDNHLSILEADGRSIILKNIGSLPINGKYKIIRKVGSTPYDIHFTLEAFLHPGMQLKLAPEAIKPKSVESISDDVVRLRGYRSFGDFWGKKVITEVFFDGNKTPCVTRTDIYDIKSEGTQPVYDEVYMVHAPLSTWCMWFYTVLSAICKFLAPFAFIFDPDVHKIAGMVAAWLIAVLYFISIPNVWPIILWYFRQHVTIGRYAFHHLVKSRWFWGFLWEQFLFTFSGIFLLSSEAFSGAYIMGIVIILLPLPNVVVFYLILINKQQCVTREDSNIPWILSNTTEESKGLDNQISVLESGARSIVLKNAGSKPLNGTYKIIRRCGHIPAWYDINFALEAFLQPGMQITLVPEAKSENPKSAESASGEVLQLRGYSSFGQHRARKVTTEIFIEENKSACYMRTDTYDIPQWSVQRMCQENFKNNGV